MKAIACCLVAALAVSPLQIQLLAAAAPPKAAPARAPIDPGWPREITRNGVKLTIYQPQIDEWKNYRALKARIAFVMTAKDGKPVIGVANLEGATTADAASRTVYIRNLTVRSARFPSLPDAEAGPMEDLLKKTLPPHSLTVSLDRLAAGVERSQEAKPVNLKMDPPKVFASTSPAILLMVEGKPVQAPITGTKLQFVVNTNWDLLFDPASSAYYLLDDKTWLTASKLDGDWSLTADLPKEFGKLPKGDQWDHVKASIPAKVERGMAIPKVYYSEEPAELIVFDGNPVWEEIEGTHLMWAKNTESWVFQDTQDHQIYFLVSGRWFRTKGRNMPMTYAGNDLPEDFKLIPDDSPASDVLASVPGTPEAQDAVLLAEVPQEAVVKCKEAEAKAKVTYDGEPKFEEVEGTQMTYAANTSSDVIHYEDKYYLCQDAVWFMSSAAVGPWTVCVHVPGAIYTIPPSCPVYRVTYVNVEPGDSDDWAVCSYTGGYFGTFVAGVAAGAALVWGTGWYYHPYVAWGGRVPIFRPWPATYGFAAAYNPWSGGYAVGGRYYGPYATAGRAAWYNPVTGNYGRAARVAGPYGARTVAAGYNPRTNTAWATRQGNNGYAQWGTSAVRRGDDWVRAGHVATNDGGVARWHGSEGSGRAWKTDDHSGGVARHDGDIYAGRDGNVYRRDGKGDWSKYNDGNWESVDRQDSLKDAREKRADNINQNRGDNRPDRSDLQNRLGANGGGERKIEPKQQGERLGQGGGGQQRINRDNIENRAPIRRAETQPAGDVANRLGQDFNSRSRGETHVQQRQSFQHSGGRADFGSRSFGGGGGGGARSFGGGGRGGGGRRR